MSDFQADQFVSLFSDKTIGLLEYIVSKKFEITLVGGGVRDFIRFNKLSHDLDFEIRCSQEISEKLWKKNLEALAFDLKDQFLLEIEFLEFGILRFEYDGKTFEFSSPRIEKFEEQKPGLKHKDFDVRLISNLDYERAFLRRDLTINAIGISFFSRENVQLIDPLNGMVDLQKKLLKPCGLDFYKDPIRFLRLIRFKLETGFEFTCELAQSLHRFNLTGLTYYYFFKEAFKTNSVQFFNGFFYYVKKDSIALRDDLLALEFLMDIKIEQILKPIKDEKELIFFLVFCNHFSDKDVVRCARYAQLGKGFMNKAFALRDVLLSLAKTDVDMMVRRIPEDNDLLMIDNCRKSFLRSADLGKKYKEFISDHFLTTFKSWEEIFSFYPTALNKSMEVSLQEKRLLAIKQMFLDYFDHRKKRPK